MNEQIRPFEILKWYQTAGVSDPVGEEPVDRLEQSAAIAPVDPVLPDVARQPMYPQPQASVNVAPENGENVRQAFTAAQAASTLQELRSALENFNASPLKETASHLVFGAGNPQAKLMIVGEAPGAEEDKQGLPFVGASGHLLDKMLNSIGLNRENVYISNVLPWRPPGNRKPSEDEIALFSPFIRRHIALVRPKILLLLGGSAMAALLNVREGITRSRGRWMVYEDDGLKIDAVGSFHPAFLLRTPAQKKMAWRDILSVKAMLSGP